MCSIGTAPTTARVFHPADIPWEDADTTYADSILPRSIASPRQRSGEIRLISPLSVTLASTIASSTSLCAALYANINYFRARSTSEVVLPKSRVVRHASSESLNKDKPPLGWGQGDWHTLLSCELWIRTKKVSSPNDHGPKW